MPDGSTSTLLLTGQDGGAFRRPATSQINAFRIIRRQFPRDEPDRLPARRLYDEGHGFMMPSVGNAGGPVFIYNPARSPTRRKPPKNCWRG